MRLFSTLLFVSLAMTATSSATILNFQADLLGINEVPPNASPAIGFVTVSVDTIQNTLDLSLSFSGLIGGNAAAAHIHCCTAPGSNTGVAVGFPGFPSATSGTYSHQFDLTQTSIYTTTFLNTNGGTAAGAEAALINGISAGQAYVNIHDAVFPGGEIRGFLIPEPSTVMLTLAGFGLLGMRRRSQT